MPNGGAAPHPAQRASVQLGGNQRRQCSTQNRQLSRGRRPRGAIPSKQHGVLAALAPLNELTTMRDWVGVERAPRFEGALGWHAARRVQHVLHVPPRLHFACHEPVHARVPFVNWWALQQTEWKQICIRQAGISSTMQHLCSTSKFGGRGATLGIPPRPEANAVGQTVE